MSEIIFRGKIVRDGKWVHGYYVRADYNWHEYGIHRDWIVESAITNGGFFNVLGRCAVDAKTIGQYTGLTDINGKKVFEGDVVKCVNYHGNVKGVVERYNSCYMLICTSGYSDEYLFNSQQIEVIGNIFDNPELLE